MRRFASKEIVIAAAYYWREGNQNLHKSVPLIGYSLTEKTDI